MNKTDKSESFEEWRNKNPIWGYESHDHYHETIWNHQQKKLQAEREKVALLKEGLFLSDEFKSDVLSVCNESDLYFDSLNPLLEWFNDNRQTLEKLKEHEEKE